MQTGLDSPMFNPLAWFDRYRCCIQVFRLAEANSRPEFLVRRNIDLPAKPAAAGDIDGTAIDVFSWVG
jgi:hypothetical protein